MDVKNRRFSLSKPPFIRLLIHDIVLKKESKGRQSLSYITDSPSIVQERVPHKNLRGRG